MDHYHCEVYQKIKLCLLLGSPLGCSVSNLGLEQGANQIRKAKWQGKGGRAFAGGGGGKPNHRLKMKYGESIAVATGGAFGSFKPNTLFPSSPLSPDKWHKKNHPSRSAVQ